MSRTLSRRLERLERNGSSSSANYHLMLGEVGDSDEDFERRVNAFRASLPDYQEERDTLLCVRFISVEQVQARQVAA